MILRLIKRQPYIILIAFWCASLSFFLPLGQDVRNVMGAKAQHRDAIVHVSSPCDFVAFWAVGRMAAAGQAADVFTLDKVFAAESVDPATSGIRLPWFYPPPALLLPSLLHALPFFLAFLVWDVSLTAIACVVFRVCHLNSFIIIVALLSPAGLLTIGLGQLSILVTALFILGLTLVDKRPLAAGGVFALLVFKPQAAILVPVVLVARGRWWGLLSGLTVALALCGVCVLLFGWQVWRNYFTLGLPLSRFVLTMPFPSHPPPITSSYEFYGISVYWMTRSLGAGLWISAAVQLFATAGAARLCWRLWQSPGLDPMARVSATICLTLLANPYGYTYDLFSASLAAAAVAYRERRLLLTDILLWTWPVIGLIISLHLYIELAPPVLVASYWRARQAAGRVRVVL